MFAEWLHNSTVVTRAEEVGAIKLLKTHFVQLPPGSFSKVMPLLIALHHMLQAVALHSMFIPVSC